jgi:hypothetical protein
MKGEGKSRYNHLLGVAISKVMYRESLEGTSALLDIVLENPRRQKLG